MVVYNGTADTHVVSEWIGKAITRRIGVCGHSGDMNALICVIPIHNTMRIKWIVQQVKMILAMSNINM